MTKDTSKRCSGSVSEKKIRNNDFDSQKKNKSKLA
jgi:hypothetical protein